PRLDAMAGFLVLQLRSTGANATALVHRKQAASSMVIAFDTELIEPMAEVSDPPEAQIETGIGTSIRKDAIAGRDLGSSYQLWGSMKFEKDGHLTPHAKKDLSHMDYQAWSSESNHVTDLGSHAYSKESLPLGREYYSQRPYFPHSTSSWGRTSLEAASSSPEAFGHAVRSKTNTPSARPDDSEYRYQGSDQFAALSSLYGRSMEHRNEMVRYARGSHHIDDEITPISSLWCFDDGGPSLPRGVQYGDEIPSLSRRKYNDAPSRSSLWRYGSEIASLSRRHDYGDEIPSLSRNWRYRDNNPLRSDHWYHDADAYPPTRYRQGASHGNGHSRHNFARTNTNGQVKITTSKHNFTKPRSHRVVNSNDNCRISIKDKPAIRDQVRGPRANKFYDTSGSSTEKAILSPLVRRDQFNKPDFPIHYEHAKFFMIKSYSEDDIHKGIKYNVWASTPNGNNKLDAAFHDAQILMKEKGKRCPVFLFFSVNTSGQFVGFAEMLGPVDFKKTMDFWEEDKWNGFFPITWHIIKDIPNRLFKHIVLENNDNRIVTFSRDTQEIGLPQGLEMLRIFKGYCPVTSILDDFDFYEEKDNARGAQKRGNSESTHQAAFSDDYRSMENLEASMENWGLDETWN
ncbi:hypothetical protein EJB05_34504, partial [Eragrostis curvula]